LSDWNGLYLIRVELSATHKANQNLCRIMRVGIMNLTALNIRVDSIKMLDLYVAFFMNQIDKTLSFIWAM